MVWAAEAGVEGPAGRGEAPGGRWILITVPGGGGKNRRRGRVMRGRRCGNVGGDVRKVERNDASKAV